MRTKQSHPSGHETAKHVLLHRLRLPAGVGGLASLVWLVLRSGRKPSRLVYPCQQAAALNASVWLAAALASLAAWARRAARRAVSIGPALGLALAVAAFAPAAGLLMLARQRAFPQESPDLGRGRIELPIRGREAAAAPASEVFVVTQATGRSAGFARLIETMEARGVRFYATGGSSGLIGRSDVVILKVNSQWDQRGGTNTDLVRSIIEAIAGHPEGFVGEIVVADNGQGRYGSRGSGGSLEWSRSNAEDPSQSMQRVVDALAATVRVSTSLWDRFTTRQVREYGEGDERDGYVMYEEPRTGFPVTYPKFRTPYGTYLSLKRGVWDANTRTYDSARLKVLNIPVLKTHSIYGVTAAVKHYMGVVSDRLAEGRAHRGVGTGAMGIEMAETRMPVLHILDAIWINAAPRRGPSTPYSEAVRTDIVAASTDPVALDAWAARELLMPAARSLGYTDLASMDPDAPAGAFGRWLPLAREELARAGYRVTMRAERIAVIVASAAGSPQRSP